MRLRDQIARITGIDKTKIPSSYQVLGEIALIKFVRPIDKKEKEKIGKALLNLLPYVKSVWEVKQIEGEYREPRVKFLCGEKIKETLHKEHGIIYKIDITKVMFSKGNLYERKRIVEKVRNDETIVDMFAGIGYFSLGIAKFSNPKVVYAIEKNSVAFKLLKENIKLNRITSVEPILGDCRNISRRKSMQNVADRIIMGYLLKTYRFLPAAFRFAKERAIIHYHDTFKEKELWSKPISLLRKVSKRFGYSPLILEKRKVKSYAPRIWHVVLDIEIEK